MTQGKAILMFLLVAVCAAGKSLAHEPSLAQAPPPLEYRAWAHTAGAWSRVNLESAYPTEFAENRKLPLHVLTPEEGGAAPVVIILHFWGAANLESELGLARRLAAAGIASVIVELPYHLSRTPAGSRSGELAIRPDPIKLRETMTQAVWDVRRTVDWIEQQSAFDAERIGIVGTSLGAFVGAAAFGVEPRLKAYCSLLGGADLAGTIWSSSRLVRERDALRRQGWNRNTLSEALQPIEPSVYLRAGDPRPSYLIAARYDTVVPGSSTTRLADALGTPNLLWIDTGHYGGFVVQTSVHQSVTQFFRRTFDGVGFRAPQRLFAPTFRLGAPLNPQTGLQVGLGIDFWKLDAQGSTFGALFLTPKGPQVFIGTKVGSGLSVGVSVTQRRTNIGALWSFVL